MSGGGQSTAGGPDADGRAAAVELDGVTVDLGDARVLDRVDLAVEPGRLLGLVGPNGAGKTTLLRAVNGRLEPDAGSVHVGGEAIADLPSKAVGRRVATVPQRTELSFAFPVRSVVEMGRFPHRPRLSLADPGADRVEWAMERTEVAHLADRPVTETSGGERQRVLLARALAQDTPVLLLDEPTASLDVNHQVRTLSLVRDLVVREGRTVVAAIHDLDLAARFCDELALLAGGRVQAAGPPAEVLTGPAVEAAFDTAAVVGENPVTASPTVTAMPPWAPGGRGRGRVHVVGGGGRGAGLLHRLAAAGYSLSVGVVHAHDPEARAAAGLDADVVTVPPFTDVEGAVEDAADRARTADVTVLADVDLGPANAANLAVAEAAERLVVVEERPVAARNHAGEAVASRYAGLLEAATVVDETGLVAAVQAALRSDPAVAADGGE